MTDKQKCKHSWMQDIPIKVCFHCGYKPNTPTKVENMREKIIKDWEKDFGLDFKLWSELGWWIKKIDQTLQQERQRWVAELENKYPHTGFSIDKGSYREAVRSIRERDYLRPMTESENEMLETAINLINGEKE